MPSTFKHSKPHYISLKLLMLMCLTLIISACQTSNLSSNWPEDLPPLEVFVKAHSKQVSQGTNNLDLDAHLVWVKRFYKGSIIYPIGWNDMIENVTSSFPPEQSADAIYAKEKLEELGLKICIEWSQSNDKRKIDSSNIAVWGNALRTSVERKEQIKFLGVVEPDVDNLINGSLSMREITSERYYPPEDYDNF